jgi:hypothetical protein
MTGKNREKGRPLPEKIPRRPPQAASPPVPPFTETMKLFHSRGEPALTESVNTLPAA